MGIEYFADTELNRKIADLEMEEDLLQEMMEDRNERRTYYDSVKLKASESERKKLKAEYYDNKEFEKEMGDTEIRIGELRTVIRILKGPNFL